MKKKKRHFSKQENKYQELAVDIYLLFTGVDESPDAVDILKKQNHRSISLLEKL